MDKKKLSEADIGLKLVTAAQVDVGRGVPVAIDVPLFDHEAKSELP